MIAFSTITKLGKTTWRFAWTATTGPYRVYLAGEEIAETDDLEYIIEDYDALVEPPPLEVLDANDTADAQNIQYPPRLILQWRGNADVFQYAVQENVSGTWTTRERVEESAAGYYRVTTPALDDVTVADWRVIALDEFDNQAAPLTFSALIVCNPQPPAVEITYDSANQELDVAAV